MSSANTILIVGHRGMLGSALFTELERAGYRVIGADLAEIDITKPQAVMDLISTLNPTHLFNCSGFTDVDGCESQSERAFAVNADGVKNLALACRRYGVHFWHFSTDYIFDGHKQAPYLETDNPNPLNLYGRSKLQGENYLFETAPKYTLIRTQWLFGPGGKNFIDTIWGLAAQGRPLKVVDDQRGCPTYTRDLSLACRRLLEITAEGVFNVTNNGSCSWYELAKEIIALSPYREVPLSPIKTVDFPRPAQRPLFSALDAKKFLSVAGYSLPSWREAVQRYLAERDFPLTVC